MENGASSGEEEILTDLPVTGIWIKGHCSSDDFDGDRKGLYINFRSKLVEIEKMVGTENNDTSIGPYWVEIGKTDSLPNEDSSFRDNIL